MGKKKGGKIGGGTVRKQLKKKELVNQRKHPNEHENSKKRIIDFMHKLMNENISLRLKGFIQELQNVCFGTAVDDGTLRVKINEIVGRLNQAISVFKNEENIHILNDANRGNISHFEIFIKKLTDIKL